MKITYTLTKVKEIKGYEHIYEFTSEHLQLQENREWILLNYGRKW